jgi:hypothetical protein
MTLFDVETKDGLVQCYEQNGLKDTKSKIDYLISSMKVKAMRWEDGDSLDERLESLEDMALLGYWRASW